MVEPEFVDEQHKAKRQECEAEAGPRPNEGVGRRRIADLRLVRPVLGPGPTHIGPARNRGERTIDQEVGGAGSFLVAEAVGWCPAGIEISRAKLLGNITAQRVDGSRQCIRHSDLTQSEVDVLKLRAHRVADRGLLVRRQLVVRLAECRLGETLLDQPGQTDQRPGGVVLAVVRAHPVQAAVIHQIGLLKSGLAGDDILVRHQQRTVRTDEAIRLWRGTFVGEDGRPREQGETHDRDGKQNPFEHIADAINGDWAERIGRLAHCCCPLSCGTPRSLRAVQL